MKKREQLPIQPCSTQELEEALEVLEGRWKILILFYLFSAPVLRTPRRTIAAGCSRFLWTKLASGRRLIGFVLRSTALVVLRQAFSRCLRCPRIIMGIREERANYPAECRPPQS
jgi:hypothetical protein